MRARLASECLPAQQLQWRLVLAPPGAKHRLPMSPTPSWKRNLVLLMALQALMTVIAVVLATVNGLAGLALAPTPKLATLPVTAFVAGGALSTFAISLLMARIGRVAAFRLGIACGIGGALVCAQAAEHRQFWLLCAGSLIVGVSSAFAQYYRFAAVDAAPAESMSRAVSLVLAGGILGAVLGPESAKWTRDLTGTVYVGSYLWMATVGLLALLCSVALDIPHQPSVTERVAWAALRTALRRLEVLVAIKSAVVGYAVMIFLMTATPLAMQHARHSFDDTAFVIEWHVLGMYAPAFVTGYLVAVWGALRVIGLGAVLMLISAAIHLLGTDVSHFWAGLVLLGIGWNFMFVGATTLLSENCTDADKAVLQGANEVCVFAGNALASTLAGVLLYAIGWQFMNQVSVPFLVALIALLLVLGRRRVPEAS